MSSEVGAGHVSIFPTFKGMRQTVRKEVDASVKEGGKSAERGFRDVGEKSGKVLGEGLTKTFESSTKDLGAKNLRTFEADVKKTTAALSKARLSELDAIGKVRVAERKLTEARAKGGDETAQAIAADERLESAVRGLRTAQQRAVESSDDLRRAQDKLAAAADEAGDELDRVGRRGGEKFKSGFSSVFKGSFFGSFFGNIATDVFSNIGYAIGSAVRGGFEFAMGSIDIASSLNESINAVQVAYPKAADAVLALGDKSVEAFGLSARELNAFATQFSGFAQTLGGNDPAKFLDNLITRGADFASVYNTEVSDALALFQSGLAGETEPLRKYGIDLSAATVEAYAYANGIAKQGEDLTEAQKQQARYQSLLEQTSKVQGDFVNTGGSYANVNRKNAATWDNLQAKIGNGFLPVAEKVGTLLADTIFPAIDEFVTKNGPSLATAFEDVVPALAQFAEDLLPKIPGILESVATSLPPILEGLAYFGPMLAEIIASFALGAQQIGDFFTDLGEGFAMVGPGLAEGWQNIVNVFTDIGERFALGGQQIGDFFTGMFGWFGMIGEGLAEGWGNIVAFFEDLGAKFALGGEQIAGFATTVGEKIGEVIQWFIDLPGRVGTALGDLGTFLFDQGAALIQGFLDGIGSMWTTITDTVGGVVDFVAGFFPNSPAKRGPLSGAGWTKLGRSGGAIVDQALSTMTDARASSPVSTAVARLVAVRSSITATGSTATAGSIGSSTFGDHIEFNGITTRQAARELLREQEKAKRRRVFRSGVLSGAGVS